MLNYLEPSTMKIYKTNLAKMARALGLHNQAEIIETSKTALELQGLATVIYQKIKKDAPRQADKVLEKFIILGFDPDVLQNPPKLGKLGSMPAIGQQQRGSHGH